MPDVVRIDDEMVELNGVQALVPCFAPTADAETLADSFWFACAVVCPVCNLGAHEPSDRGVVILVHEDVVAFPCPDCGHMIDAPHRDQYERDENGHWFARDLPGDEAHDA